MFSSVPQPPVVSLFSSTGTSPLELFETHVDDGLPADSLVCLLDDTTSLPPPRAPATLIVPAALHTDSNSSDTPEPNGYLLGQTVLHIQSPSLASTYIRCPPRTSLDGTYHLGLKHPWMCMQVRNLGRPWSFEVGVVDTAGRDGVIRCSTFQAGSLSLGLKPVADQRRTDTTEAKSNASTPPPPTVGVSQSYPSHIDAMVDHFCSPPLVAAVLQFYNTHSGGSSRTPS